MQFFDTHCHIDLDEFEHDRSEVLSSALQQGVNRILVPGITLARTHHLMVLKPPDGMVLYKAMGLHPFFLAQHQAGDFAQLVDLAHQNLNALTAIGECGIDRHIDDIPLQLSLFQQHIELANALKLPLVVHHRQSHDLIAQAFKAVKPLFGGIVHAFSGPVQVANYYIEQGFKLGIGGTITYTRAQKTHRVVKHVNIDDMVLETDAPTMPLYGFQGQRNTPEQITRVFDVLCELRGVVTYEQKQQLAIELYSSSCSALRI
jgi:TatD DNase family protein